MEDDLVMNKLPLPKYFDGEEWKTVIKPTRKCIPKYLHQDLPELKHIYIKQKFKEIGKFNCPEIDYFSKMIRHKKVLPTIKKAKKQKNQPPSYQQIKQQLQYALITTDINSNIIDKLLDKAKRSDSRKGKSVSQINSKSKKRKSSLLGRQRGKYFQNTVDLVFRQRKRQYMNGLKKGEELDTSQIDKRLESIKLLDFEN